MRFPTAKVRIAKVGDFISSILGCTGQFLYIFERIYIYYFNIQKLILQ